MQCKSFFHIQPPVLMITLANLVSELQGQQVELIVAGNGGKSKKGGQASISMRSKSSNSRSRNNSRRY